ncbi:hypothetical protein LJC58_04620 [Lachnospiraceae bacterium OttesenSCG-928-D06]|nr:hypothetical protein [Lachnospiraceae bacterium OttesenSCG-928-D06]
MWKQIKLLTKLQLINTWGFNQIRYGRDKKKRNNLILMLVVYVFLALMITGYSGLLAISLNILGLSDVMPAIAVLVVSIVILFFSMIKAGNVIFEMKTYDMLISLPVSKTAIIVSRFLDMYIKDFFLGLGVLLPITIVTGIMTQRGISYYLLMIPGALLLPLLPLTIATAIGALITAVASRMKHKNLITIVLTLGITLGIVVASVSLPSLEGEITITEEAFQTILEAIKIQLLGIYPPAKFYMEMVSYGNLLSGICFFLISVCPFVLLMAVIQHNFQRISSALYANRASKKYVMKELQQTSPLMALFKKEIRNYFSISMYVLNTLMGYLLMVVLGVAVFVVGEQEMDQMMQIPGLITKTMPLLLACMCGISSTTNSTISIEGNKWWLALSLPISAKQLFDGKILVNLAVALPCYVVTEILLLISLSGSFLDKIWLIIIPLCYILLFSVVGITLNSVMPQFQWEKVETVIKQGGSVFIAMVIGMVSAIIPMIIVSILPRAFSHVVYGVLTVCLLAITALLYYRNSKLDLRKL